MTEALSSTRVQQIIMTYQQYAQTSSNPISYRAQSPIHQQVIPRKPTATYPPLPETPVNSGNARLQTSRRTPSLSSSAAPASSSPFGPTTPSSTVSALPSFTSDEGTLTRKEIDSALKNCVGVLEDAISIHDKRPFSALLLAPDNITVLLTHNSISHVQHAESELARLAAIQYSAAYLVKCTLVSTWEPCAMCAGTIYWSNIGRVLYAASESKLRDLTGHGNEENMTMDLPCRVVLGAGQRKIEVIGPVSNWEDKVVGISETWWKDHQPPSANSNFSYAINANRKTSVSSSAVVIVADDPSLGSMGEDGEYQADLKVDWMM